MAVHLLSIFIRSLCASCLDANRVLFSATCSSCFASIAVSPACHWTVCRQWCGPQWAYSTSLARLAALSLSLSPHMSTALKWTGAGYVSVPLAAWDTGVPMQFARHSVWNSLSLSPSKLVCTDSVIRYTYISDCCTVLYPPPPPPPHSLSLSLFACCQFVLYQSVSAP